METFKNLLYAIYNYRLEDLNKFSCCQWGMVKSFYKHDLVDEMNAYILDTIADYHLKEVINK